MTPKIRQIMYVVGVVIFAALTVLSALKIIDTHTAASVSAALTTLFGLFGVTGFGTAAYQIGKQRTGGQFDDPASPGDQIISGWEALNAVEQAAVAEKARVKESLAPVFEVPVLGPLARQAIDALP